MCLDKGKIFSTTFLKIIIMIITSIERESRRLKTSGIFSDF
jgi:hypothetical protein